MDPPPISAVHIHVAVVKNTDRMCTVLWLLCPTSDYWHLDHFQRADLSRLIWFDRTGTSIVHVRGAMYSDRRVWSDASVHQIWITDASMRTEALSARVLPRGSCWLKAGRAA
jgi:hypothetical protein